MASSSDTAIPSPPPALRVLLVQAERETRGRYADCLRAAGLEVVEAETGLQALEAGVLSAPDLIVADLDMPSIDGLAFCRRLRTEPRRRDILLITLASRRAGAAADPEPEPGDEAETHLAKPCTPDRLLAEIRHLTRLVREQRSHAALRRGGDGGQRPVDPELAARIRAEYTDLPSLKLTLDQAERLWQQNRASIDAALDALVAEGFLQRGGAGRYERTWWPGGAEPRPRMVKAELESSRRAGRTGRPDGTHS